MLPVPKYDATKMDMPKENRCFLTERKYLSFFQWNNEIRSSRGLNLGIKKIKLLEWMNAGSIFTPDIEHYIFIFYINPQKAKKPFFNIIMPESGTSNWLQYQCKISCFHIFRKFALTYLTKSKTNFEQLFCKKNKSKLWL